jgi:hypothetical protein
VWKHLQELLSFQKDEARLSNKIAFPDLQRSNAFSSFKAKAKLLSVYTFIGPNFRQPFMKQLELQ